MRSPTLQQQVRKLTEEALAYTAHINGGTLGEHLELPGVVVFLHNGGEGISWSKAQADGAYGSLWPVFQWISSLAAPQYIQRGLAILTLIDGFATSYSRSVIHAISGLFGTNLIENYYRIYMDSMRPFQQTREIGSRRRPYSPQIIYWDKDDYADLDRPRLPQHCHGLQNNKYNVDLIYDAILVRWYTTDREGIEVAAWIKDCLSTMAIQIENVFVNMEYELDDVVTIAVDKLKQSCRAVAKANDELKRIREELIAAGGWLTEETRATAFPTTEPYHILMFVKQIRSQIETVSKTEVKE